MARRCRSHLERRSPAPERAWESRRAHCRRRGGTAPRRRDHSPDRCATALGGRNSCSPPTRIHHHARSRRIRRSDSQSRLTTVPEERARQRFAFRNRVAPSSGRCRSRTRACLPVCPSARRRRHRRRVAVTRAPLDEGRDAPAPQDSIPQRARVTHRLRCHGRRRRAQRHRIRSSRERSREAAPRPLAPWRPCVERTLRRAGR